MTLNAHRTQLGPMSPPCAQSPVCDQKTPETDLKEAPSSRATTSRATTWDTKTVSTTLEPCMAASTPSYPTTLESLVIQRTKRNSKRFVLTQIISFWKRSVVCRISRQRENPDPNGRSPMQPHELMPEWGMYSDGFDHDLHRACKENDVEAIERAIERGANIEQTCTPVWRTSLHTAVSVGAVEAVECLLKHRANVESKDSFGITPIFYATAHGHADCIEALIEHGGADPNVQFCVYWLMRFLLNDFHLATPLHCAVHYMLPNCVQILLDGDADPWARTAKGQDAFDFARVYKNQFATDILNARFKKKKTKPTPSVRRPEDAADVPPTEAPSDVSPSPPTEALLTPFESENLPSKPANPFSKAKYPEKAKEIECEAVD